MTAQAPLLNVRGLAFRRATSPRTPSADAVINPRGIEAVQISLAQENLADNRENDEFLINSPSWPGVKSFAAPVGIALHAATHTEMAPIFKSNFGADSSTHVLVIDGAGVHTDKTIFLVSGATIPGPIVMVTGNDGKKYPRPVKNFDVGLKRIDLGISLPAGVLPTAVVNPVGAAGAGWQELYNAAVDTYRWEYSRRGQPNERLGYADVCVVNELSLKMDSINERLKLGLNVMGAEWVVGAAANVTARAKTTEQFLSYNATCFMQSLSVITAPTKLPLRGLTLNMAVEYVPQTGQTGVDGSAADPDSNLIDYARGRFMPNGFGLNFIQPLGSRYTDRAALTDQQCFLMFKDRVGGVATPTRVLCIWFPEVNENDNPAAGANGLLEADDQPYIVGQSSLLGAGLGTAFKAAIAIMSF